MDRMNEPIWFYKDMTENTHGPYSTIEMYKWYLLRYFPSDLKISFGPGEDFIPMDNYSETVML